MGPPESKKPRRSIMVKFSVKNENPDDNDTFGNESKESTIDSNGDTVFDPCAEMMIHDFDDERTLDEEEALETSEDPRTELSDLQKEGDMPLSELLAMYGYVEGENSGSDGEDSVTNDQDLKDPLQDDTPEPQEEKPKPEPVHSTSQLAQLYCDIPVIKAHRTRGPGGTSRLLRSVSHPQSDEEEDDGDYSPDEEEWKKTIMVGSEFQAKVPVGLFKYDDALPYENDDKMLWNPAPLTESAIEKFLVQAQDFPSVQTKDDEQALYLLLQCGHNVEEALRRRRISSVSPAETMSIWSEEECRNFETGMRLHGKDFHTIQKSKVRTRSVGELVQFYYLWKKTERHDVYAHKAKLDKKKYAVYPDATDYMDKFLEEQEVGTSSPSALCRKDTDSDPKRFLRDETPPKDPLAPSPKPEATTPDSEKAILDEKKQG